MNTVGCRHASASEKNTNQQYRVNGFFRWLALILVLVTFEQAAAQPIAVSNFDSRLDTEGWTALGSIDGFVWQDAISQGGGALEVQDGGNGTFRFVAPPKFLGNVESAYNKLLVYEMRNVGSEDRFATDADITISGNGITLNFNHSFFPPSANFESFEARLHESAGWLNENEEQPSKLEFQLVLQNLESLTIQGDFRWRNSETTYLDNVIFGVADPTPSTDFEGFFDDWRIADNDTALGRRPQHGGNPGRFYQDLDGSGDAWYFWASPKYRGDLSAGYQKHLVFELKQMSASENDPVSETHVVTIDGAGRRIRFPAPYHPQTTWTIFQIPLDEKMGWFDVVNGQSVTPAEMQLILSSVENVFIRGDWQKGRVPAKFDGCGIDNVAWGVDIDSTQPTGPIMIGASAAKVPNVS